MASHKQRNKALKRKRQGVSEGDLSPKIASGLTQGVSLKELRGVGAELERGESTPAEMLEMASERGAHMPSGLEAMQHMNTEKDSGIARAPRPHFVGEDSITGYIRQAPDGRKFADVKLHFTPDIMMAIRTGMMCLKCLEPQGYPWEDFHLQGCEGRAIRGDRYMRDWQIVDIAMEFEGETHLGPAKPLAEHDAEIEEKRLKREFHEQIAQGRSPMKGLSRGS